LGTPRARTARARNRDLLTRFLLTGHRSESEIIAAEQEFFDRVWYERHLVFRHTYEAGEKEGTTESIYRMALNAAEEAKTARPDLRPCESDFEWGMWNGKLSALLGPGRRVGLPRHLKLQGRAHPTPVGAGRRAPRGSSGLFFERRASALRNALANRRELRWSAVQVLQDRLRQVLYDLAPRRIERVTMARPPAPQSSQGGEMHAPP
jgi:hypothetical protein